MNKILCKLGLHKWRRATCFGHSSSNVQDWKQSCKRCGKTITWVQPRGMDVRYYPHYYMKKLGILFWVIFFAIILLIAIFVGMSSHLSFCFT